MSVLLINIRMMNTRAILFLLLISAALISCKDNGSVLEVDPADESIPTVKSVSTYGVSVIENIEYAEALRHSSWGSDTTITLPLLLDAYLPTNAPDNRPVLILYHGGALEIGSRKDPNIVNIANQFAERGWVVFSVSYRLARNIGTVPQIWYDLATSNSIPSLTTDEILKIYPANRDAKAALRWVYANASSYDINTDYITVGGGSAGAALSVSLGVSEPSDFTNELSVIDDPTLSTTNLDQSTEVHTVLNFWGGIGYANAYEVVHNVDRFDPTDTPVMIVHGTEDETVPFSKGEELRDIYIANGVDYEFHPLVGWGHTAWDATVNGLTLSELGMNFVIEQQGLIVE